MRKEEEKKISCDRGTKEKCQLRREREKRKVKKEKANERKFK